MIKKFQQTLSDFFDMACVPSAQMKPKQRPIHAQRLPKGVDPQVVRRFRQRLEKAYGGEVDLRVNDNTSTLLSMNRPRGASVVKFSMHKMFLGADDEILQALAQYLRRPTTRTQKLLRCFMDARTSEIRSCRISPRVLSLRARGSTYDLHQMAEEVNQEFFGGKLKTYITWSRGSNPSSGRRRHIVFGSYDSRTRLVRIHPALDSPHVPEYFVRFVIFHEMLHAVLDPKCTPSGRRCVHTPEFRKREMEHPDYKRSMAWEKDFMSRG